VHFTANGTDDDDDDDDDNNLTILNAYNDKENMKEYSFIKDN